MKLTPKILFDTLNGIPREKTLSYYGPIDKYCCGYTNMTNLTVGAIQDMCQDIILKTDENSVGSLKGELMTDYDNSISYIIKCRNGQQLASCPWDTTFMYRWRLNKDSQWKPRNRKATLAFISELVVSGDLYAAAQCIELVMFCDEWFAEEISTIIK